ncbi:hypothetical protein EAE32_03835 [Kocuria tytonicola]|uniref:Phospholipase D-like domain-containing protein n=2 Tax=Kocuria tytonicola TaxID=2055946 RepID=A0A3L9L5R7_9MICC|nr:hypothetical protein EAE32_03835 [Kocuria tytonicola]
MNGSVVEHAGLWLENALHADAGDVLLTSPYLSYTECARIARAAQESTREIVLCTVLDPFAAAQGYLSVGGLRKLDAAGVALRHVDRLHAKCFIVGERGLVGSGNLTGAGLGYAAQPNREIGVELCPEQAAGLRATIEGWPAAVVSSVDLDDVEKKAHTVSPVMGRPDPADPVDVRRAAAQVLLDAQSGERELWIKVEYGEPKPEAWLDPYFFASPKSGRPGFKAGDLVLICASSTNDCYAIVEVTSEAEWKTDIPLFRGQVRDEDAIERWPWVNRTRPRLVPSHAIDYKKTDLGLRAPVRRGHVRLRLDQFTAAVRALGEDGVSPRP